ncbi:MAG: alginate export family protein [Bacteroidota bacterium]
MKKLTFYTALLTCLASVHVRAQFSLTGEVRPRTELYNGNNTRIANPDDRIGVATQQRTRLYFNYVDSTGLKIVFSPQVINFWGQESQFVDLLGDGVPGGTAEATFSVFEAYAEYAASDWYSLKVGRQAISYADQRWFGALGWAASGRAHDAFVNKFSFGDIKLDVGVALNNTKHTNSTEESFIRGVRLGYKSLQYAWATVPVSKSVKVQAMLTNEVLNTLQGAESGVDYESRTTFGILPSFNAGDFAINGSAYWQNGQGTFTGAYLYALDITYKGAGVPITLGADFVSGDDKSTNDKNERWAQPFGTNHKFYGLMDFFYVGPNEAVGVNDFYAKAVIKTGSKSKLILMPHLLSTNQDIENLDDELEGGSYGTEIDLVYDLKVGKGFNFKLGYSSFFATDLMKAYKGGPAGADAESFSQWAWMQLTFKPKFL